jgi:hypothetical protein
MISRLSIVVLSIIVPAYNLQGQYIHSEKAISIFNEYQKICHLDNGKMWGISLHGPLMFVDRESRSIVANMQDESGMLEKQNAIFQGRLPDRYGIANTTFTWNEQQWTMIMWPVSHNTFERNQLIFHEAFHSAQIMLGINLPNAENPHLDKKEGRIWLQLEWMALLNALNIPVDNTFIQDALVFRQFRRSIFADSDSTENALELLEGIPEYTGIKLSGRDSLETSIYFSEMVKTARTRSSFFRTFPYTSGPLYCFLIERKDPEWRSNFLEIKDLGDYLKEVHSIPIPLDLHSEAKKRAKKYEIDDLLELESKREEEITEKKKSIISTFIDGSILILPIKNPNMEFSPLNMMAIDDKGTFYQTFRVTDAWGILEAENGIFIPKDWSAIHISTIEIKQEGSFISGKGWKLNLKDDWRISTVENSDDLTLIDR